jgi:diguanylate cyclase (GGDEF)-like protein
MPDARKHKHPAALGVIAISLLILAYAVYTAQLPDRQKEQGRLVNHTHEVLERLHLLALHITEAETGQRGYLLSGETGYLTPYLGAGRLIRGDLNDLQRLVSDNEQQTGRLPHLRRAITAKLDDLRGTVELRKHLNAQQASEVVRSGRGKQLMDVILLDIGVMMAAEDRLLQARLADWSDAASRTRAIVLAGSAAVSVLVFAVYLALHTLARQRQAIADAERRASAIQRAETERLARIVKIQNNIVSHVVDLQASMQLITENTQALTSAEGAIVEMLDGEEMEYRAATGTAAPHVGLRLSTASSLSGLCLSQNAVLKCDDSESDPRVDRASCRKVGLRSMVVVPLRHNGHAIGALKVVSSRVSAFSDEDVTTLELMAGLLSATMSEAMAANAIRLANEELARANVALEQLATTDGLTGLKNHRTFQELLAAEYARARRYGKPLSLVLLDVDHFKAFNDTFGHPAGDSVLRQVGALLLQVARATDFVARYGGEEFALLLPETASDGAQSIADRLRAAVACAEWDRRLVTVSVGVSSLDDATPAPRALVESADIALYASKKNGRNRVTVAPSAVRGSHVSESLLGYRECETELV